MSFVGIASVEELPPGKMKCVSIDGRRLLLANVDGHYYCADDKCTHEDASLCRGSLQGARVKCPLHGSRFDLRTGEALEEPADERLKIYPLRIEGARILVDLA